MEIVVRELNEVKVQIKSLLKKLNEVYPPPGEVLTYERTMELLDCSRNTLDKLKSDGIIKVYKLRGRLYCKYSEIVMALEENAVQAA